VIYESSGSLAYQWQPFGVLLQFPSARLAGGEADGYPKTVTVDAAARLTMDLSAREPKWRLAGNVAWHVVHPPPMSATRLR
jgi:hypothetical protein